MVGQFHVGDIGSVFRVQVREDGAPLNISAATVTRLKLRKPTGAVAVKTALFNTDGSDGILIYTTVEGDLDAEGPWQGQVYLEAPSGKWHTELFSFQVGSNLGG